jgi:glycosyltransferase involved in cell wall biosynthesis
MRILFFLESLQRGGKERRALELIYYLKHQPNYELKLVLTEEEIGYNDVYNLGITIDIIKRKRLKYDPGLFIKFYKSCRIFNPDIIHTWGKMTTFYALPAKMIFRIPLISNLISDSDKSYRNFSIDSLFYAADVKLSEVILANSVAGLRNYQIKNPKAKVIHNGVRLTRFQQKFDLKKTREAFGINTEFMVTMVASFSIYKDYDLFIDIARAMGTKRRNVTFVGVGDGSLWKHIHQRIIEEEIGNVILTGNQTTVEPIIAASDIGLLCTPSEGISNSIIEFMALGKPVISTDINGGSREIIVDGETGYCTGRSIEKIVALINMLLDNPELRILMGNKGKERIGSYFSIDRMGEEFKNLYTEVLSNRVNGNR